MTADSEPRRRMISALRTALDAEGPADLELIAPQALGMGGAVGAVDGEAVYGRTREASGDDGARSTAVSDDSGGFAWSGWVVALLATALLVGLLLFQYRHGTAAALGADGGDGLGLGKRLSLSASVSDDVATALQDEQSETEDEVVRSAPVLGRRPSGVGLSSFRGGGGDPSLAGAAPPLPPIDLGARRDEGGREREAPLLRPGRDGGSNDARSVAESAGPPEHDPLYQPLEYDD